MKGMRTMARRLSGERPLLGAKGELAQTGYAWGPALSCPKGAGDRWGEDLWVITDRWALAARWGCRGWRQGGTFTAVDRASGRALHWRGKKTCLPGGSGAPADGTGTASLSAGDLALFLHMEAKGGMAVLSAGGGALEGQLAFAGGAPCLETAAPVGGRGFCLSWDYAGLAPAGELRLEGAALPVGGENCAAFRRWSRGKLPGGQSPWHLRAWGAGVSLVLNWGALAAPGLSGNFLAVPGEEILLPDVAAAGESELTLAGAELSCRFTPIAGAGPDLFGRVTGRAAGHDLALWGFVRRGRDVP